MDEQEDQEQPQKAQGGVINPSELIFLGDGCEIVALPGGIVLQPPEQDEQQTPTLVPVSVVIVSFSESEEASTVSPTVEASAGVPPIVDLSGDTEPEILAIKIEEEE